MPGNKFNVNDFIEVVKSLPVIELNELVKALEKEFGVSASAPIMMAGGGGGGDAGAADEKSSFTVILKEVGASKMAVIKAIKEIFDVGLKEAKEYADSVPKELKKDVPKDEAEKIKAKLEEAGATVELK